MAADDRHSRAVAAAALASVAPTWLAAGRSVRELWSVAVASLPSVPAHRRLMLLSSLLAALPEVSFFFYLQRVAFFPAWVFFVRPSRLMTTY